MMGAVSFLLGVFGLGTGAAVGIGQNMSQDKKIAEYERRGGWDATGERAQMYERVRKEWRSIHDGCPNCLGKWPHDYPSGPYLHSRTRNWFRAHLDAKGIPYDDIILDEVSGINWDKTRKEMLDNSIRKAQRRGWF